MSSKGKRNKYKICCKVHWHNVLTQMNPLILYITLQMKCMRLFGGRHGVVVQIPGHKKVVFIGGRRSGERAGHPLTRGSLVRSPSPPVSVWSSNTFNPKVRLTAVQAG